MQSGSHRIRRLSRQRRFGFGGEVVGGCEGEREAHGDFDDIPLALADGKIGLIGEVEAEAAADVAEADAGRVGARQPRGVQAYS